MHKLLPQDSEMLLASARITSLNDVLRALLLNSIQAECSNIQIELNVEETSLVVRDDGHGITPSNVAWSETSI